MQQRATRVFPIAEASRRLAEIIRGTWAKSTIDNRRSIFQRYLDWLAIHRRALSDNNAALFIVSTGTAVQGQHQYCKDIMAILNRMKIGTDILSMYGAGLRARGALVALQQDTPLSKDQIRILIGTLTPREAMAVRLAWKTASRWDEISRLTRTSIILVTSTEVIIDWMRDTKMTRQDPYRAARYTVVAGDWTAEIAEELKRMAASASITNLATSGIREKIQQLFGPSYGAHSIKHGAMAHLAKKTAAGILNAIDLSRIAKHKISGELPAHTVRYVQDRIAMARTLRTQDITRHL